MGEDIEHLKKHKIESAVRLPQVGGAGESESQGEAFGGSGSAATAIAPDVLRENIVAALKTIFDPEIPVNIHDLGLIYGFDILEGGRVEIQMTLTAPACPVAGALVQEVADKVGSIEGVSKSHVALTWDPPWTPERMTEEAKLELGMI